MATENESTNSLRIPDAWTQPRFALGASVYTVGDASGQPWEIVGVQYVRYEQGQSNWFYGLLRNRREEPQWVGEDALRTTPWQDESVEALPTPF